MENEVLDASAIAIREKQQQLQQQRQQQRQEALIDLVSRQTDYDRATIETKLKEWDNNYLNVIKEFMNPNFKKVPEDKPSNQSKNQMIYGEIRNFMDDVNRQHLWRKRRAEQINAYRMLLAQSKKTTEDTEKK